MNDETLWDTRQPHQTMVIIKCNVLETNYQTVEKLEHHTNRQSSTGPLVCHTVKLHVSHKRYGVCNLPIWRDIVDMGVCM